MLEDKKHRAMYQALDGSEQKLQFYSARQIACRLLGSRGYLCQKVLGDLGRTICGFYFIPLPPMNTFETIIFLISHIYYFLPWIILLDLSHFAVLASF